jgi:3-hydroxybutyrate dehydrogenase
MDLLQWCICEPRPDRPLKFVHKYLVVTSLTSKSISLPKPALAVVNVHEMSRSILGKCALVTGAGSGISLAFTRLLLSRGCHVVLADLALREEAQMLLAAHSRNKTGIDQTARAIFCQTDVSSWSDLSRTFETAKKYFGTVDIVCAGAGVFEPSWSNFWIPPGTGSAADLSTSSNYKSIDINLGHAIRLTQMAVMDHLHELKGMATHQKSGAPTKTIIHLSSVNGQATPLWSPLYNACKHGLNGFVRTMAPLEKRFGIRVAAVAPGLVKTPIWSDTKDRSDPLSDSTAWILPEEVANVMLDIVEKDSTPVDFRERTGKSVGHECLTSGGAILEVSGNRVRNVQAFNDLGPQGISEDDFDMAKMEESVFTTLESMTRSPKAFL